MSPQRLLGKFARLPGKTAHFVACVQAIVKGSREQFGLSTVDSLRSFCRLRFQHRIEEEAILLAGLTNPGFTSERLQRFIGRKDLIALHNVLSPHQQNGLIHDKALFQRYCTAAGLPAPPWHAMFFPKHPGLTVDGRVLLGREAWCNFFSQQLNDDFVTKEARTDYGKSIRMFRPAAGLFEELPSGQRITPTQLYDSLASSPPDSCHIIQERLFSHPKIREFSASDALQTLRVITLIDHAGTFHLLWALFRVAAEDEIQDNFNNFDGGMLLMRIDPETGHCENTLWARRDRFGMKTMHRHPKTDLPFADFQVPGWDQVVQLAEKAARTFLPTRWIGWDIAPTPDGPVLIEGNPYFNVNYLYDKEPFLRQEARITAKATTL